MRLRSDDQLVALFRAGSNEAFRVIHDRYRKRLLAYTRRMMAGSGQDPEDVLQDVFERAFSGLRASDRDLALRAWLYRVAHNRCVDELRRPIPPPCAEPDETESRQCDPITVTEQRETLRRLVLDVQRLPEQQRSALLLREMSGLSYTDLAAALGVTVPAVKSLLVRARVSLIAAGEAREMACADIREEIVLCHERGARPTGSARRHLRDCSQCRGYRRSVRGMSRSLTAVTPMVGPLGFLIKLISGGATGGGGVLGSSGAAASGGAAAGTGVLAAGGTAGASGALAGGFAATTMGHVATLLAAAVVTAGGAVEVQSAGSPVGSGTSPIAHHRAIARAPSLTLAGRAPAATGRSGPAGTTAGGSRLAAHGGQDGVKGDRAVTSSGQGRPRAASEHKRLGKAAGKADRTTSRSRGSSATTGSGSASSGSTSSAPSSTGPSTSGPSSSSSTGSTGSGTGTGTATSSPNPSANPAPGLTASGTTGTGTPSSTSTGSTSGS